MTRAKTISRKSKSAKDKKASPLFNSAASKRNRSSLRKSTARNNELKELRTRLSEAEETLRAIRSGEVDALLIAKPEGDQVFTLKSAERTYRVLVEEMNEGAATLSAEGCILFVNDSLASMLGHPPDRVIGSPFHRYVVDNDLALFNDFIARSLKDRTRIEIGLKTINSHFLPVLLSGRVLSVDPGIKWVSLIVADMSEQKRAEEQVVRLATAVECAADALVVTDPRNGTIQYVNPAFEKITGYSRDEVLGKNLHLLDSGRHDESFYQELRNTLKRDGFWTGRLIQKRKDGTLYEEECTYSLVKNSSGDLINYISVKRDVTEKSRLESIAQAVETVNNIGYIFAGVSHEIGNPISAIKANLDLMRKKLDSFSKETITGHLDRLLGQVSKVEYLLQSLKSFNMYETLNPCPLELPPFLESFLSMVKDDFIKKGITVTSLLQPDVKSIYADARALQQVLLNILINASDALEGRNNATIRIQASAERGGLTRIQVEDNGWGIEEARLKDLFKPFHTTKKQGTGLGLVIIKKMITKMNGTVEITSCLNKGTIVDICLPSRRGNKAAGLSQ